MTKKFNDFRFDGLDRRDISNKYMTMNRVSDDLNRIVIKVADSHLHETKYGYALILDIENVVFIKEWQVDRNFYGNEVLIDKNYFKPKKWGEHVQFGAILEENHDFNNWLEVAKEQEQAGNIVKWMK